MFYRIFPALLIVALIVMTGLAVGAAVNANRLRGQLSDAHNSLSEAIGSVEVAEGVQQRLAEENRNLRREVNRYLGDNTRLQAVVDEQGLRVDELIQIEAGLREEIRLSSRDGGAVTRTVVRGCSSSPETEVIVDGSDSDTPIYRVDFTLEDGGFEVDGHTLTADEETGEPYAEVTIRQLDPFILDIAIAEDREGSWSALASEQDNRLELEVGEFVMSPYTHSERWFEKIGVGLTTTAGESHFAFGPILSIEAGRSYVFVGAEYVPTSPQWVGTAAIAWRPFKSRR